MGRVRGTSAVLITSLLAVGVVVGRLFPPVIERLGATAPRVSWAAALTLLLGAAVVGGLAWNTWQSLHKKHERMTSDHGIKMLALAKSSALVGAIVTGGYAGFALAFVGETSSPLGRERLVHGGGAAIAGLLLMIAGLLLERACRVPGEDDDDKNTPNPTPA